MTNEAPPYLPILSNETRRPSANRSKAASGRRVRSEWIARPMPELPAVEAARRGIAEQFVGCTISGYQLLLPQRVLSPAGLSLDLLVGQQLAAVDRHGKYLALRFRNVVGVVHLKLSGQLIGRGSSIPGFAA